MKQKTLRRAWFTEHISPTFEYRLAVKHRLFRKRSAYQLIEVIETHDFGRLLILDGCVQVATRDEHLYHNAITSSSFALRPDAKSLLVVGGGDGGLLKSLLRSYTADSIKLVELDPEVVTCSQKFFPDLASHFSDPRVELVFADGFDYVRNSKDVFDMILVDAPDPIKEARKLFQFPFYRECHRLLRPRGVLGVQSESPYLFPKISKEVLAALRRVFRQVEQTTAIVPSYPGGSIGFTFGVK